MSRATMFFAKSETHYTGLSNRSKNTSLIKNIVVIVSYHLKIRRLCLFRDIKPVT